MADTKSPSAKTLGTISKVIMAAPNKPCELQLCILMTCNAALQGDLDEAAKREQQLRDQLSAAASQLAAAQAQLAAHNHLQDQLTATQTKLGVQQQQTASANQACKDALVCHCSLFWARQPISEMPPLCCKIAYACPIIAALIGTAIKVTCFVSNVLAIAAKLPLIAYSI